MAVVFKKSRGVEEAPLQGELMLFDGSNSTFFVLNQTMAFVWRNCDGTRSTDDILAAMIDSFRDVDPAAAETDLNRAFEELQSRGLIVNESNAAA